MRNAYVPFPSPGSCHWGRRNRGQLVVLRWDSGGQRLTPDGGHDDHRRHQRHRIRAGALGLSWLLERTAYSPQEFLPASDLVCVVPVLGPLRFHHALARSCQRSWQHLAYEPVRRS